MKIWGVVETKKKKMWKRWGRRRWGRMEGGGIGGEEKERRRGEKAGWSNKNGVEKNFFSKKCFQFSIPQTIFRSCTVPSALRVGKFSTSSTVILLSYVYQCTFLHLSSLQKKKNLYSYRIRIHIFSKLEKKFFFWFFNFFFFLFIFPFCLHSFIFYSFASTVIICVSASSFVFTFFEKKKKKFFSFP